MAGSVGWCKVGDRLTPLDHAAIPVTDPAFLTGWAVFETLSVGEGADRVAAHLQRLEASARAAEVPWPGAAPLAADIAEVVAQVGGPARVRVTLTGAGRRVITATPAEVGRRHRPVTAARGPHHDEPFLGGAVKHTSRAPWVAAVHRNGVDEVLLVDAEGRFTEGTTSGVLAVIDGALWTAPHDGRILESTSVTEVLARANRLQIPVVRRGPPAAGPWDALYICSSTRDLAPVVSLDGAALPGWDPVGRRLAGIAEVPPAG